MELVILVLAVAFVCIFAAALVWELHDDFKRETKGLTKLPSRRRVRD